MERPKVIKDEKWKWLDESHPINDYVKELHKYIDYLEKELDELRCEILKDIDRPFIYKPSK